MISLTLESMSDFVKKCGLNIPESSASAADNSARKRSIRESVSRTSSIDPDVFFVCMCLLVLNVFLIRKESVKVPFITYSSSVSHLRYLL